MKRRPYKRFGNEQAIRDMQGRVEQSKTPTPYATTARYCRVGRAGCLVRLEPTETVCSFCQRPDVAA
jgi:hypothetical protein